MQPVYYLTRSSFFPAIETALDAAGADFDELKVYLGPRGYERDETIEIDHDPRAFRTSWRHDPGRFSARIRAAATVLHRRGIHGRFHAVHADGRLTLQRLDSHHTILWRCIDQPGHDAARLQQSAEGWLLTGAAVFAHKGAPVQLAYEVVCDREWHPLRDRDRLGGRSLRGRTHRRRGRPLGDERRAGFRR